MNSFRLVCLCSNVMPGSRCAASNSSLKSTGKSRIITLLPCSSLMLLTSVQSIIPHPDHSVLRSCSVRYLHTPSVLLFIPSYVLISHMCPAESVRIDCRPLIRFIKLLLYFISVLQIICSPPILVRCSDLISMALLRFPSC